MVIYGKFRFSMCLTYRAMKISTVFLTEFCVDAAT